ncbi:hypothetical protein [Spirosoma endophyticum]|uniref:Uncharacterized protein n=1 Tax=Spirosoma endophyticum TaxID=662367 RepID=A0A1I2HYZ0_9BACT|nr:hypothetical protein [Spirosoma endophyticum]SFF33571.1 hypothetical protein SAMN05216167_14918 [Spirosoma endophyticum]
MNNNPLALNTRDLITSVLIELTGIIGPMPVADPDFPILQAILNELSQLNFKIVVDDINQMATTINQHNVDLQNLTQQIRGTTTQLQNLSNRLKQVSDTITFLVDTFAKGMALGIL